MVAKRTVMDMTDDRFKIAANDDVLQFIRAGNSSTHTDVGIPLLELGKALAGAHAYCPSYKSCMYVVLHTDASRIFAIAYGQRGLSFRLAPEGIANAIADGATVAEDIGPEWVSFRLWEGASPPSKDVLRRWALHALEWASEAR